MQKKQIQETYFRHKFEDARAKVERLIAELNTLQKCDGTLIKVALVRHKKQAIHRALKKQEMYYALYLSGNKSCFK